MWAFENSAEALNQSPQRCIIILDFHASYERTSVPSRNAKGPAPGHNPGSRGDNTRSYRRGGGSPQSESFRKPIDVEALIDIVRQHC